MTTSRVRWGIIAFIYAAFHFWYGGNGSPLTQSEIDRYVQLTTEKLGPELAETVREFAATDDGKEFIIVNLNKYRDKPKYQDGRQTSGTPEEVEAKYIKSFAPELFKRAAHPLMMVVPIETTRSIGDFEQTKWDKVTLIRYRSRADFLELILKTEWGAHVDHKRAALEQNHSLPTTPESWWVGVRLVPFLLLLCLGLLLDRVLGRAKK